MNEIPYSSDTREETGQEVRFAYWLISFSTPV